MTGNRSEISALKELTKTINISAAGVRLKESDKEDLMKMNLAVKEAIMVLEGKKMARIMNRKVILSGILLNY